MIKNCGLLKNCRHQTGFSLVELLVVLLIIGLGFSFVSVNVGDNNNQQLRMAARDFANRTALIAEEAVLSNQQWGVDIYRQLIDDGEQYGYRWLTRNDQGRWLLANDDRGAVDYVFPVGTALRLELTETGAELDILAKREIDQQRSMQEKKLSLAEQLGGQDEQSSELVEPALWLLSSGEMSAFTLTVFETDNTDAQIIIRGDALGRIVVETGFDDE